MAQSRHFGAIVRDCKTQRTRGTGGAILSSRLERGPVAIHERGMIVDRWGSEGNVGRCGPYSRKGIRDGVKGKDGEHPLRGNVISQRVDDGIDTRLNEVDIQILRRQGSVYEDRIGTERTGGAGKHKFDDREGALPPADDPHIDGRSRCGGTAGVQELREELRSMGVDNIGVPGLCVEALPQGRVELEWTVKDGDLKERLLRGHCCGWTQMLDKDA